MKIKKHGKKFDKSTTAIEGFCCGYCGCEFECKETEFYVHKGCGNWIDQSNLRIPLTSSTYTAIVANDLLVCSCPECHKIVRKVKQPQNYNNISVTLTGNDSNTSKPVTKAEWTCSDSLDGNLK